MDRIKLGEFEIIVLAALMRLGDDGYGMLVRKEIERQTGRSSSIGAVYTTLTRLEKKGLVSVRTGEPTPTRGGRAKRFFRIETAGRRALNQSLTMIWRIIEGLPGGWGA